MRSLKLFNAVQRKATNKTRPVVYSNGPVVYSNGLVIMPEAQWATDEILEYYNGKLVTPHDMRKTFYQSWRVLLETSTMDRIVDQILHYLSTYGTNFTGQMYLPNDAFAGYDVSEMPLTVVDGWYERELIGKSLGMLQSGQALEVETVKDLIHLITEELDYEFTGFDGIRNKEAIAILTTQYNVFPKDPAELLRAAIYMSTGNTLLIKDKATIQGIKDSHYNPGPLFRAYGLEKLARVFNRFKPLFLAYKPKCGKTINKISKLSKTHHKPMKVHPLNVATSRGFKDSDIAVIKEATTYHLLRALAAVDLQTRVSQNAFLYRVRNGKFWVTEDDKTDNMQKRSASINYYVMLNELAYRMRYLDGLRVYIPKGIDYGLPTSEKAYLNNIPFGTRFEADELAVGMYWHNDGGARDIDLSALPIEGGKIGWNAAWKSRAGLYYSGDITSAHNGAAEYLYATDRLSQTALVVTNIFSGRNDSEMNIIIGAGAGIDYEFMFDPSNLMLSTPFTSLAKQSVLGVFMPMKRGQRFVLNPMAQGDIQVSRNGKRNQLAQRALVQSIGNKMPLSHVLDYAGIKVVHDPDVADVSLAPGDLTKSTFIDLFEGNVVTKEPTLT